MRENKGITLVALIITIIVLLILAVVTISAVNEGSLFSHANNAATTYSKAQKEENTMISNWLTELAKHDVNKNEIQVVYKTWAERGVTNVTLGERYYSQNDSESYYCFYNNPYGLVDEYTSGKYQTTPAEDIDGAAQSTAGSVVAYNGYGKNETEAAKTNYIRFEDVIFSFDSATQFSIYLSETDYQNGTPIDTLTIQQGG